MKKVFVNRKTLSSSGNPNEEQLLEFEAEEVRLIIDANSPFGRQVVGLGKGDLVKVE